jgi:hypothetical protein
MVTRSHSNDKIPLQKTTTSTDDPQITVEPTTPNPTGGDIQEIVHQSLIKIDSALARLSQPNRPWGQPLDFSDIREQLGDTNLAVNPSDPNLNPAAGGSGIPPSPPPSSPSSSGGDSSDEGSSPSQPSTPTTPMANQNNPARPWLDQDAVAVPGAQHPLPKHWRNGFPSLILTQNKSLKITLKNLC